MKQNQIINFAGAFVVVAFVALLAAGWWYQRPVSDRTVILFAGLLYATLQIDISSVLPIDIIPAQRSTDEGDE